MSNDSREFGSLRNRDGREAHASAFPEQNEQGADLSLIRENLKLTPTERVRRGDRFRRGLEHLRANVRRIR